MNVQKMAQFTGHQGSIYVLKEGKDSSHILSGAGDGWIVEWDINNPELGKLLAKVESNIFSLLFLKDKNQIIAGNMNGGIHFVDLNDTSKNKNIAHHFKGVFDIQNLPNNASEIITIGGDGIITRWSTQPFQSIESLQISAKSLRCMAISNRGQEIAVGSSDGNIYILDFSFNIKNIIKNAHKNSVFSVKYAPDEAFLLSGGRDALLKLWKLSDKTEDLPQCVFEIPAHSFTINNIVFHPQNLQIFATASRDKTIKIWELLPHNFKIENTEKIQLLKVINTIKNGGHINSVNKLVWDTPNQWLLSCSDDRAIIAWKINLYDEA